MLTALFKLIKIELLSGSRQLVSLTQPLCFYLMLSVFLPLALGNQTHLLIEIGPGYLWLGALLAILLSLDQLFASDYRTGMLEHYALSKMPFSLIVLAKLIAHWLKFCFPLILFSPILALMYQLPLAEIKIFMLSLCLGTPILVFIGAIGSALTLNTHHSGILLFLLILPLTIPVLVFATSLILLFRLKLNLHGPIAFLSALSILGFTLTPMVIAAALRINIDS